MPPVWMIAVPNGAQLGLMPRLFTRSSVRYANRSFVFCSPPLIGRSEQSKIFGVNPKGGSECLDNGGRQLAHIPSDCYPTVCSVAGWGLYCYNLALMKAVGLGSQAES